MNMRIGYWKTVGRGMCLCGTPLKSLLGKDGSLDYKYRRGDRFSWVMWGIQTFPLLILAIGIVRLCMGFWERGRGYCTTVIDYLEIWWVHKLGKVQNHNKGSQRLELYQWRSCRKKESFFLKLWQWHEKKWMQFCQIPLVDLVQSSVPECKLGPYNPLYILVLNDVLLWVNEALSKLEIELKWILTTLLRTCLVSKCSRHRTLIILIYLYMNTILVFFNATEDALYGTALKKKKKIMVDWLQVGRLIVNHEPSAVIRFSVWFKTSSSSFVLYIALLMIVFQILTEWIWMKILPFDLLRTLIFLLWDLCRVI